MFSIIGKILSPLMPYLLGGAAAGGLLLTGLLYYKTTEYDKLLVQSSVKLERSQHNSEILNKSVIAQGKSISRLIASNIEAQKNSDIRNEQLSRLRSGLNKERLKNGKIAEKWSKVAKSRPKLLDYYINRAVVKRVQFFTTATCRTGCKSDSSKNGSRKAP